MFAQFVKDFLSLERGENRFDENRCANRAAWNLQRVLREIENVVPEPRFEVALHLWQIKIGPAATLEQFAGVVKEKEPESEQAAGNRFAIQEQVFLRPMPTTRTHQQRRSFLVELVLSAFGTRERNGTTDGVAQIHLSFDQV